MLVAAWVLIRLRAWHSEPVSVTGLLRFVPFFIWESLRGGIDVALRTLAPTMRIAPDFAVYRTALQQHEARVLLANCVSLLPGTLTADLQGDRLHVHLLDARVDPHGELRRLERAVGWVYPHGVRDGEQPDD